MVVVRSIATGTGVEPRAVDPPLATVIDPKALDRIVDSADDDTRAVVTFNYLGHHVTVTGNGSVSVE